MSSNSGMGLLAIGLLVGLTACHAPSANEAQDRDPYLRINTLLVNNACSNCHASDYARVGPSMTDVAAARGPDSPEARQLLRGMILNGTRGSYGEAVMPKQAQVTPDAADELAKAILELRKPQ
jgi:cytochrome c551/c552